MLRCTWVAALALVTTGCSLVVDSRLKKSDAGVDASADGETPDARPGDGEGEGGTTAGSTTANGGEVDAGSDTLDATGQGEDDASRPRGDATTDTTQDGSAQDGSAQTDPDGSDSAPAKKTAREELVACTGTEHVCLLDREGQLRCFGRNSYDQAAPPPGTFTALACGQTHTCALLADTGALTCWGDNGGGQRVQQQGPFVEVAAGARHTCALNVHGTAQCWGATDLGQSEAPTTKFLHIAAGDSFSCGIRADNLAAECWGNPASNRLKPPGETRFTQLALANDYGCGLSKGGDVLCWGHISKPDGSMLGSGTVVANLWALCTLNDNIARCDSRDSVGLEAVTALQGKRWATLFGGQDHLCAIPEEGDMECFAYAADTLSVSGLELPPSQ